MGNQYLLLYTVSMPFRGESGEIVVTYFGWGTLYYPQCVALPVFLNKVDLFGSAVSSYQMAQGEVFTGSEVRGGFGAGFRSASLSYFSASS